MSNFDYWDKDVETAARDIAGNWREFESFGWRTRDELDTPEDYAIVYLTTRDTADDPRTASNAAAILEELKPWTGWHKDGADVWEESHGHWAIGHVDGIVIRCIKDGQPTDAFRKLHELAMRIADYPMLDEEDVSRRECEAESEAWGNWGASDFRRILVKLAPHHDSLFDHVSDDHLYTIWSQCAHGGYTCEHTSEGVYFPFDRTFEGRHGLAWEDVRGIILDVKAEQHPMRLAAKFDAQRRAAEGASK